MTYLKILPVLAGLAFAAPALAQTSTMAPMKSTTTTTTTTTKPMTSGMKLASGQKFTTVTAAQASCPADTVVWSTLSTSKSFHMSTSKYYGKTKHGAYVCEKAAMGAGYHPAKT